jgi:hypothetical protein
VLLLVLVLVLVLAGVWNPGKGVQGGAHVFFFFFFYRHWRRWGADFWAAVPYEI